MAFSESLKYEVKRRAHLSCCVCKSTGIEVHHIVPKSEGGSDDIDNAAPLCPSCHEIYGANPQKRKFISEARNIWYDICQTRYSNESNRIVQLQNDLKLLVDKLNPSYLSENIANYLFQRLRESPFYIDNSNNVSSMSLSDIIRFLFNQKEPDQENQIKNLDVTYALLYKTTGEKTDSNEEYDFLKIFGEVISKKLTIFLIKLYNVNWIKGVTENDMEPVIRANFVSMIMLMHHKDLNPSEFALNVFMDNNEGFGASLAT
jgi:hypothetical protein